MLWATDRGLSRPCEVTKAILERYQRHLYHHRMKNGQPMSFRNQHSHLVSVLALFRWLTRQNHLLYNPASELELPKLEQRLPRHVLTASEAERVLVQPDVGDPLGVRDRSWRRSTRPGCVARSSWVWACTASTWRAAP